MSSTVRIAVVGAGPAAMYAIESLLESDKITPEIDVFERLPSPWGLVRSGVAPDHPEKKLVSDRLFECLMERPEVKFIGNVEIGKVVRHDELAEWYDGVIYAVGAQSDMRLSIPGETLPGCWAAREFVAWYNGHPDYRHLEFDLSCERAVVIGNGNVALDVARILTLPLKQLQQTDIADHALQALKDSRVREVVILGRRSHLHGAFNNPELEELAHVPDVEIRVEEDFPSADDPIWDGADWATRRKIDTLKQLTARHVHNPRKRITFRFLTSPIEVLGKDKVEQLLVIRNHLEQDVKGNYRVRATEGESLLSTGLVLRAIGYRGDPFPGLPFNDRLGVIRNIDGRITDEGGIAIKGSYVTGWIKRGPQGIIGTNKKCARQSVTCLLEDLAKGKLPVASKNRQQVMAEINQRQPDWMNWQGWKTIDHLERAAGANQQRPRIKFSSAREMLSVASQSRGAM